MTHKTYKLLKVIQRLFGLLLLVSVAMEIFGWEPPPVVGEGKPLMDALWASGYVFPVIRIVYVASGIALLADRYAALAGIILFPISVNILLFHAFLHPPSLPMALVVFGLTCLVLYTNSAAYTPLFRPRHHRSRRGRG